MYLELEGKHCIYFSFDLSNFSEIKLCKDQSIAFEFISELYPDHVEDDLITVITETKSELSMLKKKYAPDSDVGIDLFNLEEKLGKSKPISTI